MPSERAGACAADAACTLTVKRNCSMSPRAVLTLLALTAFMSFGIGIAFAWHGFWMVLPFAGIEMAALAAAFVVNGAHAGDYERFSLAGGGMTVEIRDGRRTERHEFNPCWVRLVVRRSRRDVSVALAERGAELPVGRHLNDAGRELLARELQGWIARAGGTPAPSRS
jgi:uncharacterized membrane protein